MNRFGQSNSYSKKILRALTLATMLLTAPALMAAGYQIDPAGSSLTFVAPSRLGDVEGKFHKWKFEGDIDAKFNVTGKITVDVKSIDTNNRRRDDHLRNADFFNTDKFPTAVFTLGGVEADGDEYTIKGSLTMLGVTKPISFNLVKDGMTLKGGVVINRQDFGMTYQSVLNPIEDRIPLRIKLKLKAK